MKIEKNYNRIIELLDQNQVEYKLFSHREALTWDDLEKVQKETGFSGTELKCMAIKGGKDIIVIVSLTSKKLNFQAIKESLGVDRVRLCTRDELFKHFGAEPGCMYPFGFECGYNIYVDPDIFEQNWVLFSPVYPTKTIQASGPDLKKLFRSLENQSKETASFNQ